MRGIEVCVGVAVATLALAGKVWATSVSPVNIEMTTTGVHARSQIVMTNTSTGALAVEPDVETMVMDEKGRARHGEAKDDFLILPAQAFIAAGASQVFRVQWVGDPDLAESRSYLVTMNELPVKGLKSHTALGVMVSFGIAVNVAAPGIEPALTVVSSGVRNDGQGRPHPFVVVENPTATHALLSDAAVTLKAKDWSTTVAPGGFEQALGTGLVQPHHRREFLLPVNIPAGVKALSVSVDLRP